MGKILGGFRKFLSVGPWAVSFTELAQTSVLVIGAAFDSWRYDVGLSGATSRGRVSLDIVVRDGFSPDRHLLVLNINIIRREICCMLILFPRATTVEKMDKVHKI